MAGFYGALGIQHAKWKLSPRAAGAEMVFSQIRLVADAVFYFLRWRLRHSRQLRDRSSRPSGIARLHPTASTKRCHPIRADQRAYGRDEYRRYRSGAGALRRKMAVAILTTVFAETSGRRLLRRPLPVRPQDGKDRTGQFLFVPEINYLLRVTCEKCERRAGYLCLPTIRLRSRHPAMG